MKIKILGCGSSSGVPVIGCGCAVCKSDNSKNKRLRASIIVEHLDKHVLIDTSPDFREQCLVNNINKIDAVLYTHSHADHVNGIDDIKSFNQINHSRLDAYMLQETMDDIKQRFPYVFKRFDSQYGWYLPSIEPHLFEYDSYFNAAGMVVLPFRQIHGKTHSAGFRIEDFAYSTDVNRLDDKAFQALYGTRLWVVDCLRYDEAPSHSHLEQTLEWVRQIKPERTVLTHMAHDFDYVTLAGELPSGIVPAYDGMVLEL